MRRKAVAALMLAAVSGCTSFQGGSEFGGGGGAPWAHGGPAVVPGVKGPHGEPIAMVAPYNMAPPGNMLAAQEIMSHSVPLSAVQMNTPPGMPGVLAPGRGPVLTPPGVPPGPGMPGGPMAGGPAARGVVPASATLPGNMPMGGGVINANIRPGAMLPGGFMPMHGYGGYSQFAQAGGGGGVSFNGQRTQIRFVRPSGMKVAWFTQAPEGPTYSTTPIEAPGRYNFPQAAIYRLKLSNIEGRPGLEVYPTMEVVPGNPKTEAFLAHSAVPVEFTNEDFKQIAEGNYLVKVIYLPDPQFQDVACTGTDEILSTTLGPGVDPIQEALRRGSILIVIRMGNVDQEAPNTPPLNAPGQHAGALPPQMMAQPGMGQLPPVAPPSAMNTNMTRPGSTFVPPPPSIPGPAPGKLESSVPPGTSIGTSSTSKFSDVPPPPLPTPGLPKASGPALPAPAKTVTPPPPPAPLARDLPDGPDLSLVPPLPTDRIPDLPLIVTPPASQGKE